VVSPAWSLNSAGMDPKYYNQGTYLFNGPVENIFFHPLLAYPERAFNGDSHSNFFDNWFITVTEFKKVIESVYKNGYILVNISSLYQEEYVNGTLKLLRKPLYIPKGKKPLILSIDDLNYYKSMIEHGTVTKLVIDKNGIIATLSKNRQNKDTISYDNEIIPIINKFIEMHPDFSLNGAKGIIALTGYNGVLGYHTAEVYKNYKSEQEVIKPVIKALKRDGWSFASHSYFHKHFNTEDLKLLEKDTDLWKKEVETLIGPTNVYVFPFGETIGTDNLNFLYLKNNGFSIFMGVDSHAFEKFNDNTVLIMRRHVDGIALRQQRLLNLNLYDANEVIDLSVRTKR
jgi:peptidoglycan/xylan/chitin deacetylase (PgdA/CDA1 family)